MKLNGRILIVSGRDDVVAELRPLIQDGGHLARVVPDAEAAVEALSRGPVPDLLVTDLGSPGLAPDAEYAARFREMNRIGRHLLVADGETAGAAGAEPGALLPRPFTPGAVEGRIAEAMAELDRDLATLRAQTWREVDEMRRAMRRMQRETVNALAATIAARDPYMHGHAQRVAALSGRVAERMGVAAADREVLETAALLHEIGKASVPIELLHKTTPLTPEELARVRAHARAGAEIVRGVPALSRSAPLIEHQSTEFADLPRFFDPEGADFVLAATLRVVDAYDAMLSSRAYRDPLPRAYWEEHLRNASGTLFHPTVVDALLEIVAAEDHDGAAAPQAGEGGSPAPRSSAPTRRTSASGANGFSSSSTPSSSTPCGASISSV